jgi:hypothetical protein
MSLFICCYAECRYAECCYAECRGATWHLKNDRKIIVTRFWNATPWTYATKFYTPVINSVL